MSEKKRANPANAVSSKNPQLASGTSLIVRNWSRADVRRVPGVDVSIDAGIVLHSRLLGPQSLLELS